MKKQAINYILDRWGNIIYESQHANQGWDGKQNNEYVKTEYMSGKSF